MPHESSFRGIQKMYDKNPVQKSISTISDGEEDGGGGGRGGGNRSQTAWDDALMRYTHSEIHSLVAPDRGPSLQDPGVPAEGRSGAPFPP